MITLTGSANRYCDGVSRRSFLRIGGLAIASAAVDDTVTSALPGVRNRDIAPTPTVSSPSCRRPSATSSSMRER